VVHLSPEHEARLDRTFAALADPTRRAILRRLGAGEASISDLAAMLGITLTGVKKHVAVLEDLGLVATEKVGRTRVCRLGPHALDEATEWIESYRSMLAGRLDRLARLVNADPRGTTP
jgi:DNA-binding transcriptional ArsR family regulator